MPPEDRCLPVSPSFIDQRLRRQYNHTSTPFNSPDALSRVALRPKPPTAVFAYQETPSRMSLDCTSCVVLSATGMLASLTGRDTPDALPLTAICLFAAAGRGVTGGVVALIGIPFPSVGGYGVRDIPPPASGAIPVVVFSDLDSAAIRLPQVITLQDSGGDDRGG